MEKRFARAETLIDRAESAARPRGARRKLKRVAKLLGKARNRVIRLADDEKIAAGCAATVSGMLTDGEQRARELAAGF